MLASPAAPEKSVLDTYKGLIVYSSKTHSTPDKKSYGKKRSAKVLTKEVMRRMFGLDSILQDDYRQAYKCNEFIFQNGKKATSNYCDKKCCTVCNRIRSAQRLSKYGNRILELNDLHLVTLTNKNVFRNEVIDEVDEMYLALGRIKKNFYKKKKRINGYRTFECTYSLRTGFNPHFHFIVSGREEAALLVELWLKQFENANRGAQDIRKVTPTKKSLLEVFKYVAKPVTKGYYSCTAFDEIMRSAKFHRSSEALGTIRGRRDDDDKINMEELKSQTIDFKGDRIEVWKYVHDLYDYVAPDGELLIGTPLDRKTMNAINVIRNSKIENNEINKIIPDQRLFYKNRSSDPIF
jgi:hypothetical protein